MDDNTIQYKTCNEPYVTRTLFVGAGNDSLIDISIFQLSDFHASAPPMMFSSRASFHLSVIC